MLETAGKQIFLHIIVGCWQPTAEVVQMFISINPEMLFLWISMNLSQGSNDEYLQRLTYKSICFQINREKY